MSQDFINAADGFLADSRAAANALVSRFDRRVQRLDAAMAAAVIAALLMVGAVLWGVTVNVIRPLRDVIGHLDRIADGDLSAAIPPRGNNDIGRLHLFRSMTDTDSRSLSDQSLYGSRIHCVRPRYLVPLIQQH
jgi:methyl-accepting chemotaxis protein